MKLTAICLTLLLVALAAQAATESVGASLHLGMAAVSSEDVAAAQLKSPGRVFAMSMIVPGSGQLYIGKKRGIAYLAAEVGLITAYFVVRKDARSIEDDYVAAVREGVIFDQNDPTYGRYMASLPVPGDPFSGWNMEDFEHATQTNNWHYVYTESDGEPLERIGPFYWKDLPANFQTAGRQELKDAEIDSESRQVAYDIREDATSKFKVATTILGVTIANHLVSAIEARIAAKRDGAGEAGPTFSLRTRLDHEQIESSLVMHHRF